MLKFIWSVSTNPVFDGDKCKCVYTVYRNRFTDQPDHSGNREYRGGVFETEAEAQAYADRLNAEEQSK